MTTEPTFSSLTGFRTPAIRHLAWMLTAPSLLERNGPPLSPAPTVLETLRHWDHMPDRMPAALKQPAEARLGQYFERLYACLMTEVLGWELLAQNLPIRSEGRTLGELDFVLRNPTTEECEHHEVAVKFYLGHPSLETGKPLWYGPNARDRLDIKTERLLNHQSRMTERNETQVALQQAGIERPQSVRLFMPGYLFYPYSEEWSAPETVPSNHLRGWWRHHRTVTETETRHWVPLRKPHWLGPWAQSQAPDANQTLTTLSAVAEQDSPRLFAHMAFSETQGLWLETTRTFVVPDAWPIIG